MLREVVLEVKSPFQHKILELASFIENAQGDRKLVLDLLKVFVEHYEKDFDAIFNNTYNPEDDEI
jgi:hypothetical protein